MAGVIACKAHFRGPQASRDRREPLALHKSLDQPRGPKRLLFPSLPRPPTPTSLPSNQSLSSRVSPREARSQKAVWTKFGVGAGRVSRGRPPGCPGPLPGLKGGPEESKDCFSHLPLPSPISWLPVTQYFCPWRQPRTRRVPGGPQGQGQNSAKPRDRMLIPLVSLLACLPPALSTRHGLSHLRRASPESPPALKASSPSSHVPGLAITCKSCVPPPLSKPEDSVSGVSRPPHRSPS